ncbi:DUF421 domain-containing protein [Pseudosulfitobacter koreensis]|uniref:DUF421 domain-containing protein n=1 Tax=Pseudosulfitobacter koreensis TaxID=2968472 RepID=A0ABT1Z0M1_9RHOB|nr:YetF domain-containing protein [Pseudosulfitobacter koreense]MCR8826684.1 DUF421 domain-containing protein [Pseudosulfitobacter koreense]
MEHLFFDGFGDLGRTLLSALILYVAVILFIRISGKRSTSQMNNFDWVVTVAMGSLMASGILLKDITILESASAIAVLLLMQWLLTFTMVRSAMVAKVVRAEPTLLYHDDRFLTNAMRRERVSEYEVLSAVRENGVVDLANVESVILEANAALSVLEKTDKKVQKPALQDVHSLDPGALS